MNKKYFECSCASEIIATDVWKEDDIWQFYMGIFSIRFYNGWKERFRLIWQIVRTGSPYIDEIVFDKKDFLNFKEYINTIATE